MSKSLGNIVVPWDVIDRHGADAFRWYFLTSKQPWDGYLFYDRHGRRVAAPVPAAAVEHVRLLRAVRERQRRRAEPTRAPANDLDRWALSRLAATVETVTERLDALRRHARRPGDRGVRRRPLELVRAPLAPALLGRRPGRVRDAAHLPGRRSRKLLAPFTPVHRRRDLRQPRRLRAERAPERLARGRRARRRRSSSRWRSCARPSRLGLAARGQAKLKVRQPLRAAVVVAAGARARGDRAPRRRRARGAQRQGAALRLAGRRARLLRGQAQLPRARPALRQADAAGRGRGRRARPRARRRARCATAAASAISVDGHDHELGADDLLLAMQPLEGYQLEREGSHAVALELELDDELRREGLAREIVHAVQNARKAAGPAGRGPDRAGARRRRRAARRRARARGLRRAARRSRSSVAYDGDGAVEPVTIEGRPLHIAVSRA